MNASRLLAFALVSLFALQAFAQEALPGLDDLDKPPPAPVAKEAPKEEAAPVTQIEPKSAMDDATSPASEDQTVRVKEGEEGQAPPQNYDPREKDERFVAPMPNAEGTIGLLGTPAAWGGRANTYRFGLFGWVSSGSDVIRFNDSNTWFAGDVVLEGSPVEYFSFNARLRASSNANSFGRPEAMLSLGDSIIGFKGYYPVSKGVYLGGDLNFFFPSAFGTAGIAFEGMSVRPRLLSSFDIAEMMEDDVNMNVHFAMGYRFDRSENLVPENASLTRVERFAYGISAYDALEIRLGLDYQLPYVTPFLEWNLDIPVNADGEVCGNSALDCVTDAGFGSFPNVLGMGVRSEPVENLGLQLAMKLGLTSEDANALPVTLPWEINFGVTWTIDPTPKVEYVDREIVEEVDRTPPQSFVLGTVVDDVTKEGIAGAIIGYPLGGETPQATDELGTFRSYGFAPGSKIKIKVTHPDYEAVEIERSLPLEPGEHELNIPLVPLAKQGTLTGMVEDNEGNPIANAKVVVSGGESAEVTTGPDGRFQTEVQAGAYTIAASADGFLTRGRDATVKSESTTDLQFVLKAEPKEKLVKLREDKIEIQQKVFFERGKANIKSRSNGLLEQVAALLAENPQIKKIEIQGHTDDAGSDEFNLQLSQDRAEAVRLFLLEQGLGEGRIVAKGYGESRPILPNTSKRNRSLNRRVEFKIIEQ